ncbi:MAG TPA: SDR family oxidoreductase [Ilumatobacter sp.]|nr:SDR family oxidoreductase [Ilumatobacter sp.]
MNEGAVVVAGAAGGIGAATAVALADLGPLVLVDRDASALNQVAADLPAGCVAQVVCADLTRSEGLAEVAAAVVRPGVRALAYTAGIGPVQTDDGVEILDVNLRAPIALIAELGPHLRPGASAVVIGSVASRRASSAFDAELTDPLAPGWLARWRQLNPAAWDAYALSKRGLARAVATTAVAAGARGVRVNVVSPAQTATAIGLASFAERADIREFIGRLPIPRMAQPGEVASAVRFLADHASAYITGIELYLDGGAGAAEVAMVPQAVGGPI